jgi:hypothetical protein
VQGDGFGFELEYVYEFGGGEPGEGCGELGVVGLKTEGMVYWDERIMFIVVRGRSPAVGNGIAGIG